MPGIAGIYTSNPEYPLESVLKKMLSVLASRPDCQHCIKVLSDLGAAIGSVSLGVIRQEEGPVDASDGPCVFLDGELYDGTQGIPSRMQALAEAVDNDDLSALRGLRGDFAAACVDAGKKRISLVSDKFGLRPLYYVSLPGGFAFSTEVKALFGVPGVARTYNQRAFADLYHFGFVLGNKTLFSEIHLLPPASLLHFDCERNRPEVRSYWGLDSLFTPLGAVSGKISNLDVAAAFMTAVDRRYDASEPIGISLSGGLDSRLILAALGDRAQGMPSYTLGLAGCRDQVLTEKMARLVGTKHSFLELKAEDLGDFKVLAETLVSLSDGFYHPHEATEKKALDFFAKAPFRIVLRGHAGEVAKASLAYPLQVTAAVNRLNSRQQVRDFILRSANLGIQEIAPGKLFKPAMASLVQDGPALSLQETFAEMNAELSPADMCLYAYLREWVRRQVVASLTIFRVHTEIRLPFMDEDFLATLLQLPLEKRFAGEVHKDLIQRYRPELAKIPDSNTGAPLTAGKMRLFFSDKINSVLKRISLPGYRHYTEYEDWQRNQFRSSLEDILFDSRTLDRGLYNPETLKMTFEEHVQGKRSCAKLLGTIAGIELYMRQSEL